MKFHLQFWLVLLARIVYLLGQERKRQLNGFYNAPLTLVVHCPSSTKKQQQCIQGETFLLDKSSTLGHLISFGEFAVATWANLRTVCRRPIKNRPEETGFGANKTYWEPEICSLTEGWIAAGLYSGEGGSLRKYKIYASCCRWHNGREQAYNMIPQTDRQWDRHQCELGQGDAARLLKCFNSSGQSSSRKQRTDTCTKCANNRRNLISLLK